MMIKFFVPGAPQGKGRGRIVKVGGCSRIATPKQTVAYESTVRLAASAAMAGREPFDGPMVMMLRIVSTIAASRPKRDHVAAGCGQIRPTGKPDADNVLKAISDACNGITWRDDSQCVRAIVDKVFGATPGVHVAIWPWTPRELL